MNALFTVIFTASTILLVIFNPDLHLKAMTDGASKGLALALSLIAIYSVWGGILQIAEDSGLIKRLAKAFRPIVSRLFKGASEETAEQITVNLSANLLGMGGIATPSGIRATKLLIDNGLYDLSYLLLIIASTSIQLLPTTVITLRQEFLSKSPADIVLPSLLSTVASTVTGILLFFITRRKSK